MKNMKNIVAIAGLLFCSCLSFAQDVNTTDPVDEFLFQDLYWNTAIEDILDRFGDPLVDEVQLEYRQLTYPLYDFGDIPAFMMMGFHESSLILESLQIIVIAERVDSPQQYFDDYSNFNSLIDHFYPDPVNQNFNWYSPIATPSFTGQEIVDGNLAMITTRELPNSTMAHSIFYSDGIVNHFLSWVIPTKRTPDQLVDEFAQAYADDFLHKK